MPARERLARTPRPGIVVRVHRRILPFTLLLALVLALPAHALTVMWPTPNPGYEKGEAWNDLLQATASGEPASGGFGCVRNNGNRFHEGIDIKPYLKRTRRGEPTDPVYAALDGRVVHVASHPGESGYGRYVVLESLQDGVTFYTLYGHLASIDSGVREGREVKAGSTLGIMGHSASYRIPWQRAHVHFEIGLRLADKFQPWYDKQKFGSPNEHGIYNGFNLVGADPMRFFDGYRAGTVSSVAQFIQTQPTAYILRVAIPEIPEFARRNPALLASKPDPATLVGWEIAFTWYGLPKQLTPLSRDQNVPLGKPGSVNLVGFNRAGISGNTCRDTVQLRNGKPVLLSGAVDYVHLIFDRAE